MSLNFTTLFLYPVSNDSSCMLRPSNEIASDGFQFMMSLKDYNANELIADEKLLFKCMSQMTGHEINVRKVVFLSVFR